MWHRPFYQAWLKLPKPQRNMRQARILSAIGDATPITEELPLKPCSKPYTGSETKDSPIVMLRLGQCLLDSGQELQARTYPIKPIGS